MKKHYFIISGIILIIAVSATSAFSISKDFSFGKAEKKVTKSDKIIAKVDNLSINEKEFASKRLFLASQSNSKVSNKTVFDAIVKQKVLVQAAKNQGITVTDEELNNFIAIQKERSTQVSQEEQSQFRDSLAGQGLIEEEYWCDPNVKRAYESGIYIGKLKKKIRNELPETDQGTEKAAEYTNKRIEQMCSSKKLEILDPTYK